MADAYSLNYANVLPGGFASWKVITRDNLGVINLGDIADGKIVVKSLSRKDSRLRSGPFAVDVDISGKMLATHKSTVLELLGSLVGPASHEILGVNGEYYEAVGATNLLGLGWRFDSSADYDGIRFVEIFAKGKIMVSSTDFDIDDFFAAATGIGSAAPSGALATWSAVGMNAAGMSAFTKTGQSTLGAFRAGKLVCGTTDYVDNHGRNVPHGIGLSIEAELMQAENTELKLINEQLVTNPTPYVATLSDGAVFTITDEMGIDFEYHNDTDADGVTFTRVIGSGNIPLSGWAGLLA